MGRRAGGGEGGDDGVDLEVAAADVQVRTEPCRATHEGHCRREMRRRAEIAMNRGWEGFDDDEGVVWGGDVW
jgi:hypothetical protein